MLKSVLTIFSALAVVWLIISGYTPCAQTEVAPQPQYPDSVSLKKIEDSIQLINRHDPNTLGISLEG